jgi:hypothetical protein
LALPNLINLQNLISIMVDDLNGDLGCVRTVEGAAFCGVKR